MTPGMMLQICLRFLGVVLLGLIALRIYSDFDNLKAMAGMMDSGSLTVLTPFFLEISVLGAGAGLFFWLASR